MSDAVTALTVPPLLMGVLPAHPAIAQATEAASTTPYSFDRCAIFTLLRSASRGLLIVSIRPTGTAVALHSLRSIVLHAAERTQCDGNCRRSTICPERAHDAERHPDVVQHLAPLRQVALGELGVQDVDQLARVRPARIRHGEARIVGQILPADRGQESAQLPLFVEQRHDEPATVPGPA